MRGTDLENSGIRQVYENNKIQMYVTNSSIHIFSAVLIIFVQAIQRTN